MYLIYLVKLLILQVVTFCKSVVPHMPSSVLSGIFYGFRVNKFAKVSLYSSKLILLISDLRDCHSVKVRWFELKKKQYCLHWMIFLLEPFSSNYPIEQRNDIFSWMVCTSMWGTLLTINFFSDLNCVNWPISRTYALIQRIGVLVIIITDNSGAVLSKLKSMLESDTVSFSSCRNFWLSNFYILHFDNARSENKGSYENCYKS